jgi:hypothetical protein
MQAPRPSPLAAPNTQLRVAAVVSRLRALPLHRWCGVPGAGRPAALADWRPHPPPRHCCGVSPVARCRCDGWRVAPGAGRPRLGGGCSASGRAVLLAFGGVGCRGVPPVARCPCTGRVAAPGAGKPPAGGGGAVLRVGSAVPSRPDASRGRPRGPAWFGVVGEAALLTRQVRSLRVVRLDSRGRVSGRVLRLVSRGRVVPGAERFLAGKVRSCSTFPAKNERYRQDDRNRRALAPEG